MLRRLFDLQVTPELRPILERETERNLNQIAVARLLTTSGWLLLSLLIGWWMGYADWKVSTPFMAGYAAAAALLYFGGRRWAWVRRLRHWAVPFVDVPFIYLALGASMRLTPYPETSAGVAGMLFVFYLMFVPSTIYVLPTALGALAALAAAGHMIVNAGVHFPNWLFTLALVFVLAFAGALLISNRIVRIASSYARVEQQRSHLGRYFSPAIAEHIMRTDAEQREINARQEITILFADIRSFTALSERLSEEDVVELLNEYLTEMVSVIFAFGGNLDKFMGDGILAYFGAHQRDDNHARQAVLASQAMQRALVAFNQSRTTRGLNAIEIGIGLHTGTAIVGDIGPPIRREFTIIGDAVNLAARIEALTKKLGQPLLVSMATAAQAGADFGWQQAEPMFVAGKADRVETAFCTRMPSS